MWHVIKVHISCFDDNICNFVVFSLLLHAELKTTMMTKRLISTVYMLTIAVVLSWAQPNNTGSYYAAADGKKGSELKTAMCGIINGKYKGTQFKQIAYGSGYLSGVWGAFKTTDVIANGDTIRDRYSNITHYIVGDDQGSSSATEGAGGYNREHSFPKSWFNCGSNVPAGPGTDMHHIYPTDVTVNNHRGNLPYGENKGEKWKSSGGYSKVGACTYDGFSNDCFEPANEWKGDFARAYFYMVTCYEANQPSWSSEMLSKNTYPSFKEWALNLLLKWARQDPVSDIEIARNEAVCAIQHNRNPFIDYPGLEEYIWGTMTGVEFDYTNGQVTYVAVPTFSPIGGTYTTTQNVTLSCATNGASIYYSTDGTTPSASSTLYEDAITISTTTTLKVIAIKDNVSSEVVEATYTIEAETPIPSSDTLVWESFSGYESGSDGTTAIDENETRLDYDSWSEFNYVYFGGGGCGKLGSSKNTGSMEATGIQLSGNGILTFKVKKYGSDGGKLNVTITGATTTGDKQVTPPDNWTEYTVNLTNANGNVGITFATSNKRAYIDDIKLVSANIPGDVNNDGSINVTDVTALVNIILGKDSTAPYIYNHVSADVNNDGKVDVTDVTELVNMVLAGNSN